MRRITVFLNAFFFLLANVNAMEVVTQPFTWGAGCQVNGNTVTLEDAWVGGSIQVNADWSAYDYVVFKFAKATCGYNIKTSYKDGDKVNEAWTTDQHGIADEIIAGFALSEHKNAVAEVLLLSREAGEVEIEKVYLCTAEEYNNLKATYPTGYSRLPLTNLNSGWSSTYDTEEKMITFTEYGGRGWWLGGVDYSDFDKLVVNFDLEPEIDGNVVIVYPNDVTSGSLGQFKAGTKQVIVPLSSLKSNVLEIHIEANPGIIYLQSAFVATNDVITKIAPFSLDGTDGVNSTYSEDIRYYSIDGRRLNAPVKGVNIVKLNGKTKKVLIK